MTWTLVGQIAVIAAISVPSVCITGSALFHAWWKAKRGL